MTEWFTLVSDVGFPVVVTLYLLHRIEAKLDTVVLSIQHLTDEVKSDYDNCKAVVMEKLTDLTPHTTIGSVRCQI